MMPRNILRFISDAITYAGIESWSLRFWFVVPFAAVGYILQAFWSAAFESAAIAGLFAATASVVAKILFKQLSKEDAEAPPADESHLSEHPLEFPATFGKLRRSRALGGGAARYHRSGRVFGNRLPARQPDGNGRHRAGGE